MDITSLTTGPKHHFYGYYGINPWDGAVRRHLTLETTFHEHRPAVGDTATVGLVGRESGTFVPYATTSAFNLQQGSMMHWIDAGYGQEFTYNDWRGGRLISHAVNPETRQMRTIQGAIAAVSPTAPLAIGLDFARMAHCRPVVGYANAADPASLPRAPEDDGLWLLDLRSGESRFLLSIAKVIEASGDPDMQGCSPGSTTCFSTPMARASSSSAAPG